MVDVMRWSSERPPSALAILRRQLAELGDRVPPAVSRRVALAEGLAFALLPISAVFVGATWTQLSHASPTGETTAALGIGALLLVVTSVLSLLFRGSILRRTYRRAIEETERLDAVAASGGATSSVGVPGTISRKDR